MHNVNIAPRGKGGREDASIWLAIALVSQEFWPGLYFPQKRTLFPGSSRFPTWQRQIGKREDSTNNPIDSSVSSHLKRVHRSLRMLQWRQR